MRLRDKVAIIAGAGDNMGRAVPMLFAQEGARQVLVSRNEAALRETAEAVRRLGGACETLVGDVTQEDVARRAVELAQGAFGGVDILVNLAGGFFDPGRQLEDLTPDFWDAAVGNLLKGMVLFCRAAVPSMAARGGGAIVNVSAAYATRQRANPAYAAAKAGMVAFGRNLARRLWSQNIRVNTVSPGLIWGEWDRQGPVTPRARRLDSLGTAPDVAYAVLYLASDEAGWVTGVELTVDGGDDVLVEPARRS